MIHRVLLWGVCFVFAATVRTLPAQRPTDGWSYNPDAGSVYRSGDFRWTAWGFAERYWGPRSHVVTADAWRRVRQGMELDLPRVYGDIRPALENHDDENRSRVLFGENTHILSREDSLSSGNLPTINRSLIREEHGSVNSFGTQWGVQLRRALNARYTVTVSAQDNRGSLNTPNPRFNIGNSIAAKLSAVVVDDPER